MIRGIERRRMGEDGSAFIFPDGMLLVCFSQNDGFSIRTMNGNPGASPSFGWSFLHPSGKWRTTLKADGCQVDYRSRREALRTVVARYRASKFAGTL